MKKKRINQILALSLSVVMLAGSVYTVPAADFTSDESVPTESFTVDTQAELSEGSDEASADEITIDESADFTDNESESELTIEEEDEDDQKSSQEEDLPEDLEFADGDTVENEAVQSGEQMVSGSCGPNAQWRIDTVAETLYITGTGEMTSNPWWSYANNPAYRFNKVDIMDGITSIGDGAFSKGGFGMGIRSVSIPNSVTKIGSNAFYGNTLEDSTVMTLSSNIKTIGDGAFKATGIVKLEMKNTSITEIPAELCRGCDELVSVTFPAGITKIGKDAFYNCESLTSLELPEGLTTINGGAFMNCSALKSINIPQTVKDIEYYSGEGDALYGIFTGCTNLKTAGPGSKYNINMGWGNGSTLPKYAFCAADGLESVVLPEGINGESGHVQDVHGAFEKCVNLKKIDIPDSFTNWRNVLFGGCESLTEVRIPEGVKKLSNTFKDCTSLTTVSIPSTVESLFNTFKGCSSLKKLRLPEIDDVAGSFAGTAIASVGPVGSGMDLEYEWTEEIPDSAFTGMNIQEVRFPDTIKKLGDGVFTNCKKLKRIALPEGITEIPYITFEGCDSLTTVKLHDKLKSIDNYAFESCPSLKNLYFRGDYPSNHIGGESFRYDELTMWYPADNKTWTKKVRKNYGGKITWKPYKSGKPVDAEKERSVTINGSGQATARFFLCDEDGNAVPEQEFSYERRANGQIETYSKAEIMTEFDGGYAFSTPYYMYSSDSSKNTEDVEYTVTWTDDAGKKHSEEFTVHVKVAPLIYSETWSANLGVKANAGASDWKWFGYGHDAESTIILQHKADGSQDLTLALTLSYAAQSKLEALDGKWGTDKLSNTKVLKTTGSAKATNYATYKTTISNFSTTNTNHQKLLASYLELMLVLKMDITGVAGTNALTTKIFGNSIVNDAMKNFEISENGIKVSVSGGSTTLTLKLSDGLPINQKFGTLEGSTTYSSSQSRDANNVETYSAGVKSSSQYSLVSGDALSIIGSGGLWGYHKVNSTSVSVNDANNVTLSESRYSSGTVSEIGYNEIISSSSISMADAEELINSDQALYALKQGKNYPISSGELAKAAKAIKKSDAKYTYKVSDNLSNTYKFEPSINVFKNKSNALAAKEGEDVTPLLELGLSLNYTHGWSTETSNGVVKNQTILLDVDSSSTIKKAQDDKDSANINDCLFAAAKGVTAQLKELLNLATASIGQKVILGSGSVASAAVTGKNWMVNLLSAKKDSGSAAQSYAVYTVSDETDAVQAGEGNEEAGRTANTVGDAFVVTVTDEDANKEVTDFSAAKLEITLGYTEAELREAGATLEDAADLAVYQYDDQNGAYIYVGGTVDEENQKVSASVNKAGEYILIYDGAAPAVTDINVIGKTMSEPVITAKILDISGISAITMDLDGKTVVTEKDFSKYYEKSTGEFSYKMNRAFETGNHTISFTAKDTKGRSTDNVEYTFTVDDAPEFIDIFVPKYALYDEEIPIRAKVSSKSDEDLVVKAFVQGKNVYSSDEEWEATVACNMYEVENGVWEGSFDQEISDTGYDVRLTVSNGNGDEVQSKVYTCELTNGDYPSYYTCDDVEYGYNLYTGAISYVKTDKTDIVIPEEIEGRKVRSIDYLSLNENVTSLTIPASVEKITLDSGYSDSLIIKGYSYSQAELFAKQNNLQFVSLGETENKGYTGQLDSLEWHYKDGVLTVSGEGEMYSGYYSKNYPWYAFKDEMTTVRIEEGVTSIGSDAFSDEYTKLKEAVIPRSVTEIGLWNFETCDTIYGYYGTAAESYANRNYIKFKILEAQNGTFGNNNEFSWKFDGDILTISGEGSLPDLSKDADKPWTGKIKEAYISKVVISDGITGIGAYGFENMQMEEVSLPDTLATIGEKAFAGCNYLKTCIVPDSVTLIGDKALGFIYDFYGTLTTLPSFVLRGNSETAKKYAESSSLKIMGPNEKMSLSDCRIWVSDAEYVNGQEVIPDYEVYTTEYVYLQEGKDYTVRFENNRQAGEGKAVFTGMGDYSGTVTKTFEIYKHEHDFGEWEITRKATALQTGTRTRTCYDCGFSESETISKLAPTGKLNITTIPLKVKQTFTIRVSDLASGDYVKSYRVSNTKFATVNAKGKITARKKGNTELRVELASGKVMKAKIKVQTGAVKTSKITVNKKSVTLKPKKSFQLKTVITPLTSLEKVTYTSSNKKVVTVSKSGKLVAKKAGKAKITVKSGKKKVTVKVTVKK